MSQAGAEHKVDTVQGDVHGVGHEADTVHVHALGVGRKAETVQVGSFAWTEADAVQAGAQD